MSLGLCVICSELGQRCDHQCCVPCQDDGHCEKCQYEARTGQDAEGAEFD